MFSSNRGIARTLFLVAICFANTTLAVYDTLYHWQYPNEVDGYNRVIQLSHAGDSNGRLIATFEHSNNSNPSSFIIRQSNDSGTSWHPLATVLAPEGAPNKHFWQPSLFEFPKQLGIYPEGTILLVGNLYNDNATEFHSWHSTNHGESWKSTGKWQSAYANVTDPATGKWTRAGIWEPFVFMDSKDRLVAVFSDERNYTHHSQMIAHVTSEDGGVSWGDFTLDVADDNQASRPGMASVAKMDNGEYFMSYEWCDIHTYPGHPCAVNGKVSTDGVTWNPKDNGSAVTTPDHVQADGSPYSIWDSVGKQLIVSSGSKRQYKVFPSAIGPKAPFVPEDGKIVHINTNRGRGDWHWASAPFYSPAGDGSCKNVNYSPNLLALSNSSILFTVKRQIKEGECIESTGASSIGILPYTSNFSVSQDAGWIQFNGTWSISGLLLRASNSATAPNHFTRYTAAIDSNRGTLNLYQVAEQKTTTLRSVPISGGVEANQEYHLSLSATSNKLVATLTGSGGKKTTLNATDGGLLRGAAGLYGAEGSGGFRNVHITAL
ncbi:hypothetical protein N7478_010080 [Penicillium angulare]|uniref:uncharacterized protein n=1 Tax=Penicillium angulare TaxID=116970 RepID=UPI00254178C2|nr:uncharacterized protein N7478_010080 [Penicillium angulare]KAJ5267272.1 hypothetical protein N7478_010080 [Penicillium angulare]